MTGFIQKAGLFFFLALMSCVNNDLKDDMRSKLAAFAESGKPAYGHQDDLVYGHAWTVSDLEGDPLERSDVRAVCGAYPMVLGLELGGIEKGDSCNLDGVPFVLMRHAAQIHTARGGIVTLSWHPTNPATGGTTWDVSSKEAVACVLKGGSKHEMFMEWLRRAADFVESLGVPVIFRPWHENVCSWFWWGGELCSPEEYRSLYRMTYDYFTKERGLEDILWCYSPNGDAGAKAYMETYPGDDIVDILGIDTYANAPVDGDWEKAGTAYMQEIKTNLTYLTELGASHGKLIALTETGLEGIPDPHWWTERMLPAIEGFPIVYVLTWRNAWDRPGHFYGPWEGSGDADNFKAMVDTGKLTFLE